MWYIKKYTKKGDVKFYSKNGTWRPIPTSKYRGQRIGFPESLVRFETQKQGIAYRDSTPSLCKSRTKILICNGVIK